MKKILITILSVSFITVFCFVIVAFNKNETINTKDLLELRLEKLLSGMSMQEKIEQLYYLTDGNERLGIPQFEGSDGPHGIGNGAKGFSSFPVTIGMVATWDPSLITRVGRAIALEQAARGRDRIAGPTLDLLIDPRIGRAPETIGEDPFLGGRISEAFVLGQIQPPFLQP
jgi:beta-glucosidase